MDDSDKIQYIFNLKTWLHICSKDSQFKGTVAFNLGGGVETGGSDGRTPSASAGEGLRVR